MPRWVVAIVVLVTTVLLMAAIAVLQSRPSAVVVPLQSGVGSATVETNGATGGKAFTPRPGLEGLSIPAFALVNQNGEPVDQAIFDGRITVTAFIFTHCQLACPPMTAAMFRVYRDLEGSPVRFVSFSVDPVNDTPERLTEYAAAMGVDTSRWMFLTGTEGETASIAEEGLKFAVSPDPNDANIIVLGDGSTMRNIRHPIKLFLVGPQRQLLDLCAPTDPEDLARFTELARKAAE